MATLVIKDFPDDLHALLKRRAGDNRRSLAKEALTLLEQAVREKPTPTARRRTPTPVRLRGGLLSIEDIEAAISEGRE